MKARKILISLLLTALPLLCSAQALKGSYFLDNSIDRTRMNPAFAPGANYLHLPGLGGIEAGIYSNWLGLDRFLYPLPDGQLGTFLHPDVSVREFERNFPSHPFLDAEANVTLFGFGFRTKKNSFWTFDLGLRTNVDCDVPADLFVFLKKGTGTGSGSYNIAGFNAFAGASLQASLGYSRDLSNLVKGLRIGARLRFIAPVAYAALNLENVRLTTATDSWTIDTEGYLDIAAHGLQVAMPDVNESLDDITTPSFAFDLDEFLANRALRGYGISGDLGVEYQLRVGSFLDGLSFSAAVTDLGAIFYQKEATNSYETKGHFTFEGFNDISADTDFDSEIDQVKDEAVKGLVNLNEVASRKLRASSGPRVYAGIELPFLHEKMSVGMLYSSRFSQKYARHELTASYNLEPCNWFALGVNWSFLNSVKNLGFILELTPRIGPTIRFGMDYLFAEFGKAPILEQFGIPSQLCYLPTGSLNLNMNFSLAFNIGGKRPVKHIVQKEEVLD